MASIRGRVALITGANGGIGYCLLQALVARGAKKIYATGLDVDSLKKIELQYDGVVVARRLDITDIDSVEACAAECSDVDLLINNAGIECAVSFLSENAVGKAVLEAKVNYFGMHNMTFFFKQHLANKPKSALVNILSVASFTIIPKLATYCASKAAGHFLTQAVRAELQHTSVRVQGVYPGYVDTDMVKNLKVEKASPESIANEICNGIESEENSIFPDEMSKRLCETFQVDTPFFDRHLL